MFCVIRKSAFILKPSIAQNLLKLSRNMSAKFVYPAARVDDTVKENFFGTEVADPYRWLEDPDAKETQEYVDKQNAITSPFINSCTEKEAIKQKITTLWNYPKRSVPFRHGDRYFQYRNSGLQNQSVLYVCEKLGDEGEVFLDPNTLSEDGTVALSISKFSEDGSIFAYGLSSSGSDWIEIHFRDVATKKDFPDVLKKVKYSGCTWTHDHKGVFYGGYHHHTEGKADGSETTSMEDQKLYYHKLGTDQSADINVLEFENKQMRMSATVSDCGKYLVVTACTGCKNNLLYIGELPSTITGKLTLKPVVTKLEADYDYITNVGEVFVIQTNKDAPNYRLINIQFSKCEESNWTDLIAEDKNDVLEWAMDVNDDKLVVCYLRDVKNVLQLHNLNTGKKFYDFKLDVGTITSASGKRKYSQMFYSFYSFLTPNIVYQVDFKEGNITTKIFHQTKVGDFDASKYETNQVFYESKDGTKIPMFIVHKKGLKRDGNNPCLLYGYGGFNVSMTPSFSVSRLVFIDGFDGVYALANIRGGGEYGDKWHNGGRFGNKQNTFDDFQWAAKYLIKEKFTSPKKLVIEGGSNGGLLVAACLNQSPDLYGAVICKCGVLDMMRYHKFTIGHAWKSDYGCSDEEEQFKYLIKYSPLHNVRLPAEGAQYPATMVLTADHDDRVVPLHSLKFIAKLQNTVGKSASQANPLMVRVETRTGHGAGKPTSKLIEEMTDVFCFISRSLNLKFQS